MKQVCEGENPLCQLNIGAKKDVNPQPRVSKMHVYLLHSVLCVTFLVTCWGFSLLSTAYFTHTTQIKICSVLHKAPKAYYNNDTEL